MANFTFTLEKYHGTASRHTCPNCNARREFSRYIDANGKYLADEVGKCNRESKCNYHFTPKEYFSHNPAQKGIVGQAFVHKKPSERLAVQKGIDFISFEILKRTLTDYRQNGFVQFLINLFPDNLEAVRAVIQKYAVGTFEYQKKLDEKWQKVTGTCFWQIDRRGNIRTGKLIAYNQITGKRIKETNSFVHSVLKYRKELSQDFNLKQCFFGEHLLTKEPSKTVVVVEAEKTAVIASICFPEMIWLAVGAKGYLNAERLQLLESRKILLFPDADAYSNWKEKAVRAQRNGSDVRISSLIEMHGTETEKENGLDLADYLIAEIKQKNEKRNAYESLIRNPHFNGWTNASLF